MADHPSRASGVGLERLCNEAPAGWMHTTAAEHGLEYLEAFFQGHPYYRHRHDTYAIGLTLSGVQAFHYRGSTRISMPGDVVVLHPDELHDGYAGTEAGFRYNQVYVEPDLIYKAVQALYGHAGALPFVRNPVVSSQKLSEAIKSAFLHLREPLAVDSLILHLAEGLLEAAPGSMRITRSRQLDIAAVERAREFLDAEKTRVVHSTELEAITGLVRYDFARQFRLICGTSPYRYLLMRRLDYARELLALKQPLAEVALEAGFADQAHFTRMFKAAYGMTPTRYSLLTSPESSSTLCNHD